MCGAGMDPGTDYERMIQLFDRVQRQYNLARAVGDPMQFELSQQLEAILARIKRLRSVAMRNARY